MKTKKSSTMSIAECRKIDPTYPAGQRDKFAVRKEEAGWGSSDLPLTTFEIHEDCDDGIAILECDDEKTANEIAAFLNKRAVRTPRC